MRRRLVLLLLAIALPIAWPRAQVEVVAGDPLAQAAVEGVRARAGRGLQRLLPHFPGVAAERITIVLHSSEEEMPAPYRERLDPGTQGFALRGRGEIHVLLDTTRRPPPHDVQTVIEHELVHVLLDRFAGEAGPYVSRWFHEGLAVHLTGEAYLGGSEEESVWRAMGDRLLPWRNLHETFPREPEELRVAYAQSFSFVSYLERHVGLAPLIRAARFCRPDRTYAEAFTIETGIAIGDYEGPWREWVRAGSGAGVRLILQNCFGLLLVLALPLLVLAGMRKWREEHDRGTRLQAGDGEAGPGAGPGAGADPAGAAHGAASHERSDPSDDGDDDPDADIDADPDAAAGPTAPP